ncbi:hypothetical protein [Cellulosimicrobium cellulans]|uniref:hypothetical protein n=1 Tax=Cellulosimicrobium cellulans TaxID=1710 RepID=UPI002097ADC7|nr:hypothetical protein [Cellulosimicrobium cellulans]MCO7274667.1 hypothetical protein [Cellulosimicrobium cellulans]
MALYHYGLSKPPRDQRRRRWWAVAVLVLCALVSPFVVAGAVQAWLAGDAAEALMLTLVSILCLSGVGSAVWGFVDSFRGERPPDGGPGQPSR